MKYEDPADGMLNVKIEDDVELEDTVHWDKHGVMREGPVVADRPVMKFDAQHVLSALGILIGGLGTILSLLVAFGVDITPDQHTAILAVGSLLLLIVSVFLAPYVPLGTTAEKPDEPPKPTQLPA